MTLLASMNLSHQFFKSAVLQYHPTVDHNCMIIDEKHFVEQNNGLLCIELYTCVQYKGNSLMDISKVTKTYP